MNHNFFCKIINLSNLLLYYLYKYFIFPEVDSLLNSRIELAKKWSSKTLVSVVLSVLK